MAKRPVSSDAAAQHIFDTLAAENRKQIAEQLFEKLRDAILTGALPPGYVFPNENELCQKLNIGRSSLREAYSPLETLQLITRSKAGTYVNEPSKIQNIMNFEAIAQHTGMENLAEFRKIMEVGVAASAAAKATAEDVEQLEILVQKMAESENDPAMLSQLDFDFHARLVRITCNELLIIAFNTIRSVYEEFTESVFERGHISQPLEDHRNIIRAVAANDPVKASAMMQQHLCNVEAFRKTMQ